ncbi:MDS1 and EVI1 complex locus protein EVI1-B-like [Folsomia candida]|uniref:MDS1 and EVI1 complex locus protein EVI1-B-like n=1 Tax=Folsomia candida TaxID=158441 RepID=UPI001604D7C8|nr:MDS1 and EVI1 complex locus protein EVI1-B-like [Folsomia candida]
MYTNKSQASTLGHKRPGHKSNTEPAVKKPVESSEERRQRLAKELMASEVFKFNELRSYKGQIWLVKTNIEDLQLKLTTLCDQAAVCTTYKKVDDGTEDYTYHTDNCAERFLLLFEIEFTELVGCGCHAAANAAEAWSYLVSRLIKYQYLVNRDTPSKYRPLFHKTRNTEVGSYAKHWGSPGNVEEVILELYDTDVFTIQFNGTLHKVFDNLKSTCHFYRQVDCTRQSLQQLITQPAHTRVTPKSKKQREDVRPVVYVCHLCGSSFELNNNLNQHLRKIHLAKLIKCPQCTFTSYSRQVLGRHTLKHSTQLRCTVCGKPFTTAKSLKFHLQTQH